MFKEISTSAAIAALLFQSASSFAANTGSIDNSFNPAFSLILHEHGFNLGESEMGSSANIDPEYRGVATLALDPAGGISVENAFVQTTALGDGLNLKFGRFFSGLGYLNEQHAHAWDFVDQPLVYAILWENQLAEDGLQLKWLAPTDMFIELGAEMGRGRGFPGTDTVRNGNSAGVLFAHIGDDIGIEHSWRVGVSSHQTRRVNAESVDVPDLAGNAVTNLFTGDSQTTGLDFVWKYAANGNVRNSYVKLQGEYFRRKETGDLTYDTGTPAVSTGPTTDSFSVTQSGFYLQSVYQFLPRWRVGARYDCLDSGIAQIGASNVGNVISDYAFNPTRTSMMLDYSPSEFSRLRMQVTNDQSRQGLKDNQFFVQYIMSLGAHGAHSY